MEEKYLKFRLHVSKNINILELSLILSYNYTIFQPFGITNNRTHVAVDVLVVPPSFPDVDEWLCPFVPLV